jgi:hypothetical protein
MNLQIHPRYFLTIMAIFVIAPAGACASGGSDSDDSGFRLLSEGSGGSSSEEAMSVQSASAGERGNPGAAGAPGSPAAAATAAPARPAATVIVTEKGDGITISSGLKGDTFQFDDAVTNSGSGSASIEQEIASATDGRVIIRTADLSVTVNSVTESMEDISKITIAAGGWVVTSFQPRNCSSEISIRVPADRFDDVIE